MINLMDFLAKMKPHVLGWMKQARYMDGWLDVDETASYASASSITLPVSIATMFPKGARVRILQSSGVWKYLVAIGTSVGVDDVLTVNLTGGSDYTVANEAITRIQVSYQDAPPGWPVWFNWTPNLTGFSVDPTNCVYRFAVRGNTCQLEMRQATNGTSNSTAVTISLPIVAATIANMRWIGVCTTVDNSVTGSTYGCLAISSGGSVMDCYTNPNSGAWTNTGGKRVGTGSIFYEF